MIHDQQFVTVCPAGRRRFLEVLVPYLLRERRVIDRHDFWVNTSEPDDLAYLAALERKYPDFFRLVHVPNIGFTKNRKIPMLGTSFQIGAFYPHAAEPGTVYVRVDDDIVYVSPDGLASLAAYRIAHPEPFLVYPTIINNSIMTHLLQVEGVFGRERGTAERDLFGRGWHDARLAEHLHRRFLGAVRRGEGPLWRVSEQPISDYLGVSVNCISWLGSDLAACAGEVGEFEEKYLAHDRPGALGRPNCIADVATVAHFSYGEQRGYLERTNLLSEYRRLIIQ